MLRMLFKLVLTVWSMGNHSELQKGAKLYHVEKRMVKKDNVVFYLLDSFEVIQQKDAA